MNAGEQKIFAFIDDWKDSEDTSDASPLAHFARLMSSDEMENASNNLDKVWANTWHCSAEKNFGMFNLDLPIRFRVGMSVIEKCQLPSLYSIANLSTYKTGDNLQRWEQFTRSPPSSDPQKGPYSSRRTVSLHKLIKPNAYGFGFFEFLGNLIYSLEEYLDRKCGQTGSIDLNVAMDQADFVQQNGWDFLEKGEKGAIVLDNDNLRVTLWFRARSSAVASRSETILGLVDSEAWALRKLHFLGFDDGVTLGDYVRQRRENEIAGRKFDQRDMGPLIEQEKNSFLKTYWHKYEQALLAGRALPVDWWNHVNPERFSSRRR